MISEDAVNKAIEKHNLKALRNPESPRESMHQVVHEMKRKGMSNAVIARELGVSPSSVRSFLQAKMVTEPLPEGTHVEFKDFEDEEIVHHGVVQSYLPPDGKRFKGGYHVACYYVVPPEDVTVPEGRRFYTSRETAAAEDTVVKADMNLSEITVEMVANVQMKTGLLASTIVNMLSLGWRYVEKSGEVSRWEHPMWRLEGQVTPASYAPPTMYELLAKPIND